MTRTCAESSRSLPDNYGSHAATCGCDMDVTRCSRARLGFDKFKLVYREKPLQFFWHTSGIYVSVPDLSACPPMQSLAKLFFSDDVGRPRLNTFNRGGEEVMTEMRHEFCITQLSGWSFWTFHNVVRDLIRSIMNATRMPAHGPRNTSVYDPRSIRARVSHAKESKILHGLSVH